MSDNYLQYPVWTRSIELDTETMEYKVDINQFLAFFEFYLNDIVNEPDKEAAIHLLSTAGGLELQVVSVDFSKEEINEYYDQYITFLAEPNLINKIVQNIKKSTNASSTEEVLVLDEILAKFLKMKKEIKDLRKTIENKQETSSDLVNEIDKPDQNDLVMELKNKILVSLTEKEILEKDKQYFQEIVKNFSNQNINIINNQTTIMSQQNFQNSNINNSGNLNFGQNYSHMISNAKLEIAEMVVPDDLTEDTLIQIQGYLMEILELVSTNQEIPEAEKEVAIKAVNKITRLSQHNADVDDNRKGIIQNSIETIAGIFSTVNNTISSIETVKNLAGIFGLKI